MPAATPAGEPKVVLMPRFASGSDSKSYMYVGPGSPVRTGPGPKCLHERAGLVVDLQDPAGERGLACRADHRHECPAAGRLP